jgi:hypothetical protein
MRAFSWAFAAAVVLVATANCGTSSNANPDAGGSSSSSGGGTDAAAGGDGADDEAASSSMTVTPFDKTLFAFQSAAGGARRTTAAASFPTGGPFQQISLHVKLDCPMGGCDVYDRTGSLGVVTQPAVDGGSHGTVVEIARFITPFGVAAAWDFDVTDLAPLLTGDVTLQGFIDTWSPQMNPGANGAGWLLTAAFTFTPGVPQGPAPVANIPVWSWAADSDPPQVPYGDPSKPLPAFMKPQTVTLPGGATSYRLRSFVTGHGQGNYNNCAEFCPSTHTVTIGSMPFTNSPWRTCCTPDPACEQSGNPTPAPGVTPGQRGTYWYPRSGWCPGAAVGDWTQDVTAAVSAAGAGTTATLSWGLDAYMNTCRPDINDAGTCDTTKCAAGTCTYDGGLHTEPIFYISSLLVAYK